MTKVENQYPAKQRHDDLDKPSGEPAVSILRRLFATQAVIYKRKRVLILESDEAESVDSRMKQKRRSFHKSSLICMKHFVHFVPSYLHPKSDARSTKFLAYIDGSVGVLRISSRTF